MKVALIHDHLAQDGGAEKVLRVFADMFPDAPIYTLLAEKEVAKNFGDRLRTSIIQHLPGGVKHYQWYMPFMPMAVEFFDLSNYDVVLSDASAFAKGAITSTDTLHICYCHTPTRYIWDYTHKYIEELHHNKYLKKVISLILNYIRLWDRQAADRVDSFIANSKTVQRRISKYYRRNSTVIYPPVEVESFQVADTIGEYFLIGGRLAPYKRVDIVVEAFVKLGLPLKIFGDGVDLNRLRRIAAGAPNIEFLGRVDERRKAELYRRCRAFINPQEEDFGITVVEAMAAGRPVIAYNRGGATETVIEGKTGLFFNEQTAESLMAVVKHFAEMTFEPALIRQHAELFSTKRFKSEIENYIASEYKRFKDGNENLN
ncbi:MAG: glycosyltransferase [Candidatus Falkowbacteria bacterium]|nr:glycosyltransferase [Candidatus Falkowbacteria bacterium]